jgi:Raf kinase inhibitor-like YbhB/YbcL family protein
MGKIGYSGPCPPEGEEHTYSVRIYGLDEALDLNPGSTREALEKKMTDHIIQYGQADVLYRRRRS